MVDEIESLQLMLSDSWQQKSNIYISYLELEYAMHQTDIKHDLEWSHLKTRLKLMKETLTKWNKNFKKMENFRKNNEQLLILLEK
jgi:hypothetical protein